MTQQRSRRSGAIAAECLPQYSAREGGGLGHRVRGREPRGMRLRTRPDSCAPGIPCLTILVVWPSRNRALEMHAIA